MIVGTLLIAAAAGAGPSGASGPAAGPGQAVWEKTFEAARARASAQHKVIFVEIGKDQCGECERMEHLLYPAVTYEMLLLRMVPVRLDLDDPEVAKLRERFALTKTAPTTLIVSPGGALIFRSLGFDDDRSFYAHVYSAMKSYDALNVRLVHEPETIGDPKAELAIGRELYRRFDAEEALPRLERAASSPKASPAIRDEALAYLASAQLDTRRIEASRTTAQTIIAKSRDADRREQAEIFLAQISLAEMNPLDAETQLRGFLKSHPKSSHRAEAEALLKKIAEKTGK